MDYIIIGATALIASLITFFSGFGLGTILTPVMLLFFPLELAISCTAIVHLLNNLFKFALIGKHLNKEVLIRFGGTAVIGVYFGAKLLTFLSQHTFNITSYKLFDYQFDVSIMGVVIGIIMLIFAILELMDFKKKFKIGNTHLLFGGVLSGFFGGLTGNQGALRSIFLIKYNLSKEAFIATGTTIACLVDIIRLIIYGNNFSSEQIEEKINLLIVAVICAFIGAYFGKKFLNKITLNSIKIFMGILLIIISLLLMMGIV